MQQTHICQCHNTTTLNLQTAGTQASAQDDDLNGKFILVKYERRPLVGQVLQVIGDEIEVSCMQQLGRKNVFTWPHIADIIIYYSKDVQTGTALVATTFRCHYKVRKKLHDTGSTLKMIRLQEGHILQKEKKGMINCNASLYFVVDTFIQFYTHLLYRGTF